MYSHVHLDLPHSVIQPFWMCGTLFLVIHSSPPSHALLVLPILSFSHPPPSSHSYCIPKEEVKILLTSLRPSDLPVSANLSLLSVPRIGKWRGPLKPWFTVLPSIPSLHLFGYTFYQKQSIAFHLFDLNHLSVPISIPIILLKHTYLFVSNCWHLELVKVPISWVFVMCRMSNSWPLSWKNFQTVWFYEN